MYIEETPEFDECLKECLYKFYYAYSKLTFMVLSKQERFEILWTLAFIELQELEKFRLPN